MDQLVLVKMNTGLVEPENQTKPSGNSFPLPECQMNFSEDCITSLSEPTSSSDRKFNQMEEHQGQENADLQENLDKFENKNRKLEFQLSLREYDSNQNSFPESDDVFATKLGVIFDSNYKIKEEIQVAFYTAQQAQNVIDNQDTEIRLLKADLQLADCETRKEIGRREQLQVEFEELKKNAAVIQREKEELEKEIVALKASVIKRKADWLSIELQINAENYGLKKALGHLGMINQRMLEKNESLKLSARSANELAEKYEAKRNILRSTIVQLKSKLSSCQSQMDELKKDATFFRESSSKFELTASQLRKEVDDLRAEMKSQEETLLLKISEVDRIRDENSLLKSSFKKPTIDQQNAESKLALKISQLEKKAIQARQAEALAELELATKYSKGLTEAENAESDLHQKIDELKTDSKSTENKNASWLKKWLIKRGSSKRKPEESELTKLLQTTGIFMRKRAKDLKEQAKIVAVKGKRLIERAQQLSRK